MNDAIRARVKRLREERDKIQGAAASQKAEREERLAAAEAQGRAAGDLWVMTPASYERMKQLSDGSSGMIEDEVRRHLRSETFREEVLVPTEEWNAKPPGPVMVAYRTAFIESVNEMLRQVDEDR